MDRRGFFRSLGVGVGAAVAVVATAPRLAPKPQVLVSCLNGNLNLLGGIGPRQTPRWRNYAAKYTPIARHDLLAKFRKAGVVFQPPVGV